MRARLSLRERAPLYDFAARLIVAAVDADLYAALGRTPLGTLLARAEPEFPAWIEAPFDAERSQALAEEYARQIPPRIIALILGIDPERSDDFTTWVQGALELGLQDEEIRQKYSDIIRDFFVEEIKDRMENPGDDLISFLLQAEIDGEPVPLPVVRGNVGLMLVAGIDTTWSSIGSALWHLATYPDDRQRLLDEPDLLPTAIEEFLRYYAPVTMARVAETDISYEGVHIKSGDKVLMNFPAACHDPSLHPSAVRGWSREQTHHIHQR